MRDPKDLEIDAKLTSKALYKEVFNFKSRELRVWFLNVHHQLAKNEKKCEYELNFVYISGSRLSTIML